VKAGEGCEKSLSAIRLISVGTYGAVQLNLSSTITHHNRESSHPTRRALVGRTSKLKSWTRSRLVQR
jgi:hypothetical protein